MTLVPVPGAGKSLEKAVEAALEFAGAIIRPPLEEIGLTLTDQVRSFRFKRQIRILLTARSRLEEAGIDPESVPLRTIVPLLEGASLEDDPELSEKWAGLLTSAAAGSNAPPVLPSFPVALAQLTPLDAKVLDYLWLWDAENTDLFVDRDQARMDLEIEHEAFAVARDTLLGLRVVEPEPASMVDSKGYFRPLNQQGIRITSLGRRFVTACQGP